MITDRYGGYSQTAKHVRRGSSPASQLVIYRLTFTMSVSESSFSIRGPFSQIKSLECLGH